MTIKKNKKAFFDYEILKKYDAGIVLDGWEVKSIKAGNFSFEGSFVVIRKSEPWLMAMNIGNWPGSKPKSDEIKQRKRKLLLNKSEIKKLSSMMNESNRLTIVPLELFVANNLIKLRIGIGKGKRKYEKKDQKKKKDFRRDLERQLKYV